LVDEAFGKADARTTRLKKAAAKIASYLVQDYFAAFDSLTICFHRQPIFPPKRGVVLRKLKSNQSATKRLISQPSHRLICVRYHRDDGARTRNQLLRQIGLRR
jgi:hypothetical protein